MIIKSLYLYWLNSDWLWKSEKFMLFLVTMVGTSIFTGAMTYWGLYLFTDMYVKGQLLFCGFAASGVTISYWIYRWCHYISLTAKNKMDRKGVITKDPTAKQLAAEAKLREREISLGFAKDLK